MGSEPGRPAPLVLAIVLNYELPDVTANCVASLLASDYPCLDVVVVDNGSRDDSVARLRRQFTGVLIVETGANLYFAGGMNVGLMQALERGAEYALILNNDTVVAPDMVSELVRVAEANRRAAVVAPLITDARGSLWALGSVRRRCWPFPRTLGWTDVQRAGASDAIRVDYVTGCGMLVRKDILGKVGLLDPAYRMYYEDADFCARVAQAGYSLWVAPDARMTHLVSLTAERQAPQSRYMHTRYRVRFYRRHRQPLPLLGCVLLLGQEITWAMGEWLTGRRQLAQARCCGLRDGLRDAAPHRGNER